MRLDDSTSFGLIYSLRQIMKHTLYFKNEDMFKTAQLIAQVQGKSLSEIIDTLLDKYVAEYGPIYLCPTCGKPRNIPPAK